MHVAERDVSVSPLNTPILLEENQSLFPRTARLLTAEDFRNVFRLSKKNRSKYFVVMNMPNGKGYPRLGLAISKKHLAKAIKRNTVKRIIRESFRLAQSKLGGIDVLILSHPGIINADKTELRKSLDHQWKRLSENSSSQ